ncbi:MAG: hypothetical protein LJF04_15130 [Gemmatimonadetes bacterium]|nr:hypothetical protein [Gemmatimonadota bacterium]
MSPERTLDGPHGQAPRHPRASVGIRQLGLAVVLAATLVPRAGAGQRIEVTGYALGVAVRSGSSALIRGGTALLARARIMPKLTSGPVTVDVAYEHVLQRTPEGGGFAVTNPGGSVGGSGDWLGLDWSVMASSRASWRQRFDRLSVAMDAGPVTVTVGRQAISWATTLFLTPADPFAPFDPSDPFRAYRGGVDAVRVRAFPGPFSEVEAVVRGADTPNGKTLTALSRFQTSRGGWALGGWGGVLHDQAAGALFATGAVGATALRTEAEVRKGLSGGATVRGAMGLDRRFSVSGRDLYVVVEAQYDGFGAANASELLATAASKPYSRGEMQVLGRWSSAGQASFQIHPLVSLDGLVLVDLEDGSLLLAPGATWSATASASVRVGVFTGAGRKASATAGPRSEYGMVPTLGYISLSWFF